MKTSSSAIVAFLSVGLLATRLVGAADVAWTAADGLKYKATVGGTTATVTGYEGTSCDIVIPETISYDNAEYYVTTIGPNAFKSSTVISNVVAQYVTNIGDWAFGDCKGITNIVFSENLTTVGSWVCRNCNLVGDYKFPNLTSCGQQLFYGDAPNNRNITSIEVPALMRIPEYFHSSTAITNLVFSPNVSAISKIMIPNAGDLTLTNMTSFSGIPDSKNITSVYFPRMTSLPASAFSACSALMVVRLPRVTSINRLSFRKTGDLDVFYLPQLKTIIGEAFWESNIRKLKFPYCTETVPANAFSYCNNLVMDLWIHELSPLNNEAGHANLTNIAKRMTIRTYGGSFTDGNGVNWIYDDLGIDHAITNVATIVAALGATGEVVVPDKVNGKNVVAVEAGTFRDNANITSVALPKRTEWVGLDAFLDCPSLTEVKVFNESTEIIDALEHEYVGTDINFKPYSGNSGMLIIIK